VAWLQDIVVVVVDEVEVDVVVEVVVLVVAVVEEVVMVDVVEMVVEEVVVVVDVDPVELSSAKTKENDIKRTMKMHPNLIDKPHPDSVCFI
jgi:hypothetical protein